MSPFPPARRVAVAVAGATVAVVAAGLLVPTAATSATTSATVATGVASHHSTFTAGGKKQSVHWVTAKLSARTSIVVATPRRLMGAKPMTTLALARQEHAVAGLNGDTFYFDKSPKGKKWNPSLGPRGGVVTNGSIVKAPLKDQNAIFYVTKDGRAHVGPVAFTGTLVAPTGGRKAIASVNSIETAWNGNLMVSDNRLLDHAMPSCVQAVLNPTGTTNQYRVAALRTRVTTYKRIGSGQRSVMSCANKASDRDNPGYLVKNLRPGRIVTAAASISPGVTQLVSGTRQLIRNGKPFNDTVSHRALNVYGNEQTAETFVCVSKDRRAVSLGVFEGKRPGAAGVTYKQETQWLDRFGCWEAMAVDGSTSSTLVAARPRSALKVLNRPTASDYPGNQRPQTDGILILSR